MCASNCIGKQEAFARDDKRANGIFAGIMPLAELCRPSRNEQGRLPVAPLSEACEAA
jgi:hypothetical protein